MWFEKIEISKRKITDNAIFKIVVKSEKCTLCLRFKNMNFYNTTFILFSNALFLMILFKNAFLACKNTKSNTL
jgi:hypothetical protein